MILRLSLLATVMVWLLSPQNSYNDHKTDLTVKIKRNVINYNVFGLFLMPGEEIIIELISSNPGTVIYSPNISRLSENKWRFINQSPTKLSRLNVCDTITKECIQLNIFTKVPYQSMVNGRINNYRIGEYPSIPWKGNKKYVKPDGFIELTKENKDVKISPHFTIGQFLCKQESSWPKYLIIREELLLKLEYLLQAINHNGYTANSLHIMSGYRTPFYNKAIGNVMYSRHVFGDAADIFIDEDKDGKMDDINMDGSINEKDIKILYDIIERISHKESYKSFIGGLGKYKKTTLHSGFVHIDTRGYRARW